MALIETLLVANHAEVHDGLLSLMGAGWSELHQAVLPGQPPPPFHFGVGITVIVGWSEPVRQHNVMLYMRPEDGGPELFRVQAALDAGRVGDGEATDIRAALAVTGIVQFPAPGRYRLAAELPDDVRHVTFRVHHDPARV